MVLLCTTSGVFAQDPQLFDTTWYVTSIDLDGNKYPTPPISPINSDLTHVTFLENTKEFFATFCDGMGGPTYVATDTSFELSGSYVFLIGTCETKQESIFQPKYFNVFLDDVGNFLNPFAYEFTTNGSEILLSITNSEGNTAYYSNQPLSTPDFQSQSIQLYPNPVLDNLNIASEVPIRSIHVYDIQGREVYATQFQPGNPTINTEALKAGVYFLKAENDTGQQFTAKFVKR